MEALVNFPRFQVYIQNKPSDRETELCLCNKCLKPLFMVTFIMIHRYENISVAILTG